MSIVVTLSKNSDGAPDITQSAPLNHRPFFFFGCHLFLGGLFFPSLKSHLALTYVGAPKKAFDALDIGICPPFHNIYNISTK
ncbi:hypothetical protein A2906_03035 [Candidatus Nomurabacteria bacterium RIFCSPLOWO2_01_FULL_37_25]|nr:MAG: hypothetical protein A2640_00125 [Candidatus Nomurabacteria bacterium RIFCSPHIGHO2_01_FULL_36_23]OGI87626.1 MAG: hypothetical protein A2906_03035 [Candidatus Nomurabacteria bacterium RIFCSPLOWO2_01_FULL_37_25]